MTAETAHQSLNRLERDAETDIAQVDQMLEALKSQHHAAQVAEIARKLVGGVSHVLEYLQIVAQIHPIAGIVVAALKKVVSLEIQRHENKAQIAVVHATMVKTVFQVRFLARFQNKFEDDLDKELKTIFTSMGNTMSDFGHFVETYNTCWQRTYKLLFSDTHKKELDFFSKRFHQQREELDEISKTIMEVQLASVLENTEEILQKLRVNTVDPDVEKAEAFVRKNGGADVVRMNSNLVDQVAAMLHEKATASMKETLRLGFDDLLEKHSARYLKKLESVQDGVIASVKVAELAIIERLNDGPHELIEDSEIRAIWERNRWKSSVKCRIFVEGLHEHYQREFLKQRSLLPHKDAWTLAFFSRVMYHSAIGDVVDDDGSGYISASEVNDFISEHRSVAQWTKPEWFAFWACGWYNNNAWYYGRIKHIIEEAEESIVGIQAGESEGSGDLLRVILSSLKPLVLVADVEDFSGTLKAPHQLRRLQEKYRAYEEKKIEDNLIHFEDHLNDRASLNAAVGDSRVELHMMPLLYILMKRLQKTVGNITKTKFISGSDLIKIEELATSCIAVFVAFGDRMQDLVRGWRFQGKDINKQVDRYADGLFRKCYGETYVYQQAYDALCKCIFGSNPTIPRHLRPFQASMHRRRASSGYLAREVAGLLERVKALEAQLAAVQPCEPTSRSPSVASDKASTHHGAHPHIGKMLDGFHSLLGPFDHK
ncbi:hypothetical protein C2E23DRAFT_121211 [Lenzites betulinus]|nr:hypothetical protein C2E23DRAFT_121211 [Lenzites betulinus]